MKYFIIFLLLTSLCISCNKFEHKEKKHIKECQFCELADSLEGTYYGRLVKRNFAGFNDYGYNYDTILDTLIGIHIERTFEGLNHLEDSLVYKFYSSYLFEEIYLSENSIQNQTFYPKEYTIQKFKGTDSLIIKNRTRISNTHFTVIYYDLAFEGGK